MWKSPARTERLEAAMPTRTAASARTRQIPKRMFNPFTTFGVSLLEWIGMARASSGHRRPERSRDEIEFRARSLVDAMAHGGRPVAAQEYANRPLLQRVKERLALGLMRLALFLTGRRY